MTVKLEWTDALLTGHKEIDADHRRIFSLAEHLTVGDSVTRARYFAVLAMYLTEHLKIEEAALMTCNLTLPALRAHKEDHAKMRKILHEELIPILQKYSKDIYENDKECVDAVLKFLQTHLIPHILTFDIVLARAE